MSAGLRRLCPVANLNNPAGRLVYWLEKGQQREMNQSAMGEWCKVWGLDAGRVVDRVECMRRGAMLMQLAQDVRHEAEQLPDGYHPEVMLTHFGEIESALDQFTVLPSNAMQAMFGQIQGTGWQCLRMLDAMLSTHRPERIAAESEVKDHIDQVRELIADILADEGLDPGLKRYIIARLRDVEKALIDALITGSGGLELAANSLFGAAQRERDLWDRIAETKWAPRIGATWMAIVTTLGAVGGVPALLPKDDAKPVEVNNTVVVNDSESAVTEP